jgi:hypothetical protein
MGGEASMAAPKKYPDELRVRAVRLWRDTQNVFEILIIGGVSA